ncbi:hypothetical protein RISK_006772 [Rhodopirellula islandica]|uniref:Uncharacterized protein n=1 Tax=Rhodopirellula islandica TaxID=595434 RepID=A0A0J1B3K0_RHOIS|nr:hypothetical protein RISK_006772 [Rhodopirellula islandica]
MPRTILDCSAVGHPGREVIRVTSIRMQFVLFPFSSRSTSSWRMT